LSTVIEMLAGEVEYALDVPNSAGIGNFDVDDAE
jgi:hypothetical protein